MSTDKSPRRISATRHRLREDGPVYARSEEQDYLEPDGGTLATMRIRSRAREQGGRQTCAAQTIPPEHCTGLESDVTADQRRGVYILFAAVVVLITAVPV